MTLWLWPLAVVIGLILGLFGAGGGMTTVPALIFLAHLSPKEAIATSLWIVSLVSLTATIHQRVWRIVQMKLLLTFGLSGMVGSFIGAQIGIHLHEGIQLGLFALLTLVVAVWMLRVELPHLDQPQVKPCRCSLVAAVGIGIGLLTGLLGVGGGFLLVPALLWLGISHLPSAVGHSLILIGANAAVGGLTYLGTIPVNLELTISVSISAAVGSIIGGLLLRRFKAKLLQRGFSGLLLVLGTALLYYTITV